MLYNLLINDEFILQTTKVLVQGPEQSLGLLVEVVGSERPFQTVFIQWVPIGILSHTVRVNGGTDWVSILVKPASNKPISPRSQTVNRLFLQDLLGVEVWDAFTTNYLGEYVLMGIYHGVDS